MLLNELRNDQIYPYFWNANGEAGLETSFIDLALVQKQLDQEPSATADTDRVLEAQLFGSTEKPLYTGWTMDQFTRVGTECGFTDTVTVAANGLQLTVHSKRGDWNAKRARRERTTQKIWEWRKGLRKTARGLRARAKALFSSPLAESLRNSNKVWLNLGAGEENYDGYLKVDLSGGQHLFDNIVTLEKIADGSVDRIYCNHVLEHIPVALIPQMLRRWHQVLKPGGVLLARAPDAKQAIRTLGREWQEAAEKELLALGFPNYLEREQSRSGKLDSISCIQTVYGWSSSTPHAWDLSNQHKSLWTPLLAQSRLRDAGFDVESALNLGTLQTVFVARRRS